MVEVKPTISLIWIGHVDHGKSTTLGHLLSLIGAIDSRTIEKLKEANTPPNFSFFKKIPFFPAL